MNKENEMEIKSLLYVYGPKIEVEYFIDEYCNRLNQIKRELEELNSEIEPNIRNSPVDEMGEVADDYHDEFKNIINRDYRNKLNKPDEETLPVSYRATILEGIKEKAINEKIKELGIDTSVEFSDVMIKNPFEQILFKNRKIVGDYFAGNQPELSAILFSVNKSADGEYNLDIIERYYDIYIDKLKQ